MKTCPICKARCFDDMEVCYGCMHRFDGEAEAFGMPVEDSTPMAEMPLRPVAVREAPAPVPGERHGPDVPAAGLRAPRREAPRVFGARGDDAAEDPLAFADAGMPADPGTVQGGARPASQLELMTGPVAVASLGGGYRLVVSIERA